LLNIKDELLDFTRALRVLYVEDNAEAREAVSELLLHFFDEVILAEDGQDGLEKFRNTHFDMVISDIKMPKMDGIEMMKIIRQEKPEVAIVIATAHQESEYLLECIRCSVDGYLLKPIDIDQLEEAILKVSNQIYCDRASQVYEENLQKQVQERTRELELAHKELMEMVNRDPMTGLYNRRYFNEISNILFQIAKRENTALSALMIDIDRFKLINDEHGHLVGDIVLKKIASVMLEMTRKSDIVVRFGGEEFVILLPSTDVKGALLTAQKIREEIESIVLKDENTKEIRFTVSIGVSTCDCQNDINIEELVHRIDVAMYDAKRSGRNKVAVYTKDLHLL